MQGGAIFATPFLTYWPMARSTISPQKLQIQKHNGPKHTMAQGMRYKALGGFGVEILCWGGWIGSTEDTWSKKEKKH
jgi:hypothetical protein